MDTGISSNTTAERVASYWSWRSQVYDTTCSKHTQWHDIFLAPFKDKKSLRLLDMGAGTGFLSLGFAKKGHRVTGIDLSPEMVNFARKMAREKNISIEFFLGDAQEPPLFSSPFDGITCRNLLWTLPNPLRALTAWKRLLKPQGLVVIADGLWEPRLYLAKEEPVTIKFKEAYSEIREQLPYFLGLSAENGFSLLEQAGFSEISRHDHLFHENPYEYNNEFFVLSAVNDCRKK
ncbi:MULTISPECIES: class I SAM-dependent methyltransferase [Aminobacterium]|jgi:ubiquinone/menaquinone biosynthesis C-methylase UbiE|uniref:Methyltransferase type 11 n=1 Tax=Aminobacterium colombiense (strain DSM 12261 / ALA-1) TaxID=572547 RepID=D5EDH8_AMICL|nr:MULTISPECIES: class I SAM-dependent methyltransferase [Aminobacterium]ADE56610.1 Methyltransferase type 11 [Aminobacterium colombiense DSM 12261]MDD4265918.1 methyltransferase domain-containing protein [Aminobacterium colombiense]MDD4586723.1 methyltransferase domain-containing protein [Aminobacterium colombiense]NLK31149.1 class I SAM-dependent methyltransferase [Aminobacterium colombiense]